MGVCYLEPDQIWIFGANTHIGEFHIDIFANLLIYTEYTQNI